MVGRQPGNGLLYGLADQSNGDPVYGYDLALAADTASNVLSVNAFDRVAQLAGVAGDDAGATLWQARAAELAASVNAALRRTDGVYVDGVLADGTQSGSASQEANALALAYGVAPPASRAGVGAYVASLGVHLGPNHGLELLRGLSAAGRPDAVVRTLTDRTIPGSARILALGGTFTWEVWSPSDLIGDSMSHGWGSSASLRCRRPSSASRSRAQPGRDHEDHRGTADTGPAAGVGVRAHRGGARRAVLAAVGAAGGARSDRARQPDGTRPPPGDGCVAGARGRRRRRPRPGVVVQSAGGGLAVLEIGGGTYRFIAG